MKSSNVIEPPHPEIVADHVTKWAMQLKLRAADKMAWICDDWVQRGIIDARSALADARLSYGDPFTYSWSKLSADSVGRATDEQSASPVKDETDARPANHRNGERFYE